MSPQLRSLALCRPLAALEINKMRHGRDGQRIFEGVDTQFLGLALIDHIMGESFFADKGIQREQAISYLSWLVRRMKPSANAPEVALMAGIVFDAFANSGENQRPFRIDFWDENTGEMAYHDFRLIVLRQTDDERGHWDVTKEALSLYLGVLSFAPEIAHEIEQLVLRRLILEGRIDEAARLAERARVQAQFLRRDIEDRIFWASRGNRVDWAGEISPRIAGARADIKGRCILDTETLRAVASRLPTATITDRPVLVRVRKAVEQCRREHNNLDILLNSATRKYLEYQAGSFTLKRLLDVNPEVEILLPLLGLPVKMIAEVAHDLEWPILPPVFPSVLDPSLLAQMAEDRWREPKEFVPEDGGDSVVAVPWVEPTATFSPEARGKVAEWFTTTLIDKVNITTDDLLELAEQEGFDAIKRRLIAIHGINAMVEPAAYGVAIEISGTFSRPEAYGDRITYTVLENHDGV